jgi:hypothetical protein
VLAQEWKRHVLLVASSQLGRRCIAFPLATHGCIL